MYENAERSRVGRSASSGASSGRRRAESSTAVVREPWSIASAPAVSPSARAPVEKPIGRISEDSVVADELLQELVFLEEHPVEAFLKAPGDALDPLEEIVAAELVEGQRLQVLTLL